MALRASTIPHLPTRAISGGTPPQSICPYNCVITLAPVGIRDAPTLRDREPPVPPTTRTSLEDAWGATAAPVSPDASDRAGCSCTAYGSAAAASRHLPRPTAAPHASGPREAARDRRNAA
nr:uncharacterized protein LOC117843238 [Setaria viridis]